MPAAHSTKSDHVHWLSRIALRLTAFMLLCALAVQAMGQAPAPHEYQVKAVFLFNFTQFVDWPAAAFADARQPIVICILGDDPFGSYLDDTVRGEKVDDRALAVRRLRRVDDVKDCQVLFVSRSEAARVEEIVSFLQGRSILTVSDADAFGKLGGMVRFVAENNRIRLRINVAAARSAGLTISSKLLRVAEISSDESNR